MTVIRPAWIDTTEARAWAKLMFTDGAELTIERVDPHGAILTVKGLDDSGRITEIKLAVPTKDLVLAGRYLLAVATAQGADLNPDLGVTS